MQLPNLYPHFPLNIQFRYIFLWLLLLLRCQHIVNTKVTRTQLISHIAAASWVIVFARWTIPPQSGEPRWQLHDGPTVIQIGDRCG